MNQLDSFSCVRNLLDEQTFAVLATLSDETPYTNLIAFTPIENYKALLFPTLRNTSKYNNLIKNKNVSICFDNRKNKLSDFIQTTTITALGTAKEVEKNNYKEIFLKKHPYLFEFVDDEDCAIVKIKVRKYIIVEKFQKVKTFNF